MGWVTHVFVAVCFLGISFGISNAQFVENNNDPLNFDETEEKFANVFIQSVINSHEFGKTGNMDFKAVTDTLLKAISLLKQRQYVDATQKKALMLAFCSSIAELIVEQCDAEVALEEKTKIVTDALRNAYLATTGKPNNNLIKEVKFLVGIFLAIEGDDLVDDFFPEYETDPAPVPIGGGFRRHPVGGQPQFYIPVRPQSEGYGVGPSIQNLQFRPQSGGFPYNPRGSGRLVFPQGHPLQGYPMRPNMRFPNAKFPENHRFSFDQEPQEMQTSETVKGPQGQDILIQSASPGTTPGAVTGPGNEVKRIILPEGPNNAPSVINNNGNEPIHIVPINQDSTPSVKTGNDNQILEIDLPKTQSEPSQNIHPDPTPRFPVEPKPINIQTTTPRNVPSPQNPTPVNPTEKQKPEPGSQDKPNPVDMDRLGPSPSQQRPENSLPTPSPVASPQQGPVNPMPTPSPVAPVNERSTPSAVRPDKQPVNPAQTLSPVAPMSTTKSVPGPQKQPVPVVTPGPGTTPGVVTNSIGQVTEVILQPQQGSTKGTIMGPNKQPIMVEPNQPGSTPGIVTNGEGMITKIVLPNGPSPQQGPVNPMPTPSPVAPVNERSTPSAVRPDKQPVNPVQTPSPVVPFPATKSTPGYAYSTPSPIAVRSPEPFTPSSSPQRVVHQRPGSSPSPVYQGADGPPPVFPQNPSSTQGPQNVQKPSHDLVGPNKPSAVTGRQPNGSIDESSPTGVSSGGSKATGVGQTGNSGYAAPIDPEVSTPNPVKPVGPNFPTKSPQNPQDSFNSVPQQQQGPQYPNQQNPSSSNLQGPQNGQKPSHESVGPNKPSAVTGRQPNGSIDESSPTGVSSGGSKATGVGQTGNSGSSRPLPNNQGQQYKPSGRLIGPESRPTNQNSRGPYPYNQEPERHFQFRPREPSDNPFLSLPEFEVLFGQILEQGSKQIPTLIQAILRSKGHSQGTLNLREFVKNLSAIFGTMRYENENMRYSELYVELLMETLIGTLEIIRNADSSCLVAPTSLGGIPKYVNAFYDILI